jgi:hypothetical protein
VSRLRIFVYIDTSPLVVTGCKPRFWHFLAERNLYHTTSAVTRYFGIMRSHPRDCPMWSPVRTSRGHMYRVDPHKMWCRKKIIFVELFKNCEWKCKFCTCESKSCGAPKWTYLMLSCTWIYLHFQWLPLPTKCIVFVNNVHMNICTVKK